MMEKDWQSLLKHASLIVQEAGTYIRSEWGNVRAEQIEDKSLNSLVSYVDRTAEQKLVKGLSHLLPEATFLTEEDTVENQDSPIQWIIDPLDGTTNYLHGVPFFVVSVGLRVDEILKIGIIYEPIRDELFSAVQGNGSFLNGTPIRVSRAKNIQDALLATGFPYYDYKHTRAYLSVLAHFMENARGIRRCGAAALDLAYVACGRFDAFFEYSLNPWDVAAGILLVQEAGGKLGDFRGGNDFLFGKELIATNETLFPQVDQVIRNAFGG